MKYNPDPADWISNRVEKLCTDVAVGYGKPYFDQLETHMTAAIKKHLGRSFSADEFELMTKLKHRVVKTNLKKRPFNCFTTLLWNHIPILEVEFSDYFYFRQLNPNKNEKSKSIIPPPK